MSLITLENVTKRYGADLILEDVSLRVSRGDRIALIGPNGCGKSTLLKILVGQEEVPEGSVHRAQSCKFGYLAQEAHLDESTSLYESMLDANAELQAMGEELSSIESEMAENPDDASLLKRYDELMERYQDADGYAYESEVREVLAGLGFARSDFDRPIAQLSGGQKARAALAKLLLSRPDLLLLDEPTNHLDMDALGWLEEYLSRWEGGFVLASHDRYAIDALATKIWELEFGTLSEYPGNYTKYRQLKQERVERQQKLYEEQQEFIQKTEEFIRRNFASGRTLENQAKSKRKMLDKLERVEPPKTHKTLHMRLPLSRLSGREVLRTPGFTVGFPAEDGSEADTELARMPDAKVWQGERVAIIGPNGCGKTTLLRVLEGELEPLSGSFEWGHNVDVAYFRQSHGDQFRSDHTVLDALMDGRHQRISEARDFLGKFLFSDDDVYKRLDQLSGGERSRVALARLAQLEGNTLLLDEPTNHLDIASREALQEALINYEGTILFVSHDRYLIQALATQIWEIRSDLCHMYPYGYDRFLQERGRSRSSGKSGTSQSSSNGQKPKDRASKRESRQTQRRRRDLEAREAELTEQLSELEIQLTKIESDLESASYDGDQARIRELSYRYEEIRAQRDDALNDWERVMEELETETSSHE